MDLADGGVKIIDYKTGASAPKSLAQVDKEQLLVYQLAAQEFFQERVLSCQYWYLNKNVLTEEFLGSAEELKELRQNYIKVIKNIIAAAQTDTFAELHKDHQGCQYKNMF